MKVLYDAQIFHMQRVGGISRLFTELFRELTRRSGIEWKIELDFPHNAYIRSLEQEQGALTSYSKYLAGIDFKGKGRLFEGWKRLSFGKPERQRTIRQLRARKVDVFHPTYYDDYFLSYVAGTPLVLTVYDMIHELFPQFLNDSATVEKKARLIEKADCVIAISENTKADLVRLTGVRAEKVTVVHLAGSLIHGVTDCRKTLKKPDKYLLFVGQRGGYKNFERFFRAIAPLMQKDRDLFLVCLGGKSASGEFLPSEKDLIVSKGLSDRVVLRFAPDSDVALWYRNAICLVFPSLYEGFGLPLLEAFNCGCPVAASNTSSLPEVGGEAVVYFDPESIDSIRDIVGELLASTEQRKDLVGKGFSRASEFSWSGTAEKIIQVYQKACDLC